MASLITDHLYDNGPVNEHGPCIAGEDTFRPFSGSAACGRPESEHAHSEYDTLASRYEELPKHAGADGACPDYGSRYDPCPPGCASGTCVYDGPIRPLRPDVD